MPQQPSIAVIGGGQSGLAAARALRGHGLEPIVLEASDRACGSWPRYYDSLNLFSPARYSAMPGLEFDGDPDRYPSRDEVADYLLAYADRLDVEIRTRSRVSAVDPDGPGFVITLEGGEQLEVAGVVAATGTFGSPVVPDIPGLQSFAGEVLHSADYRAPDRFAGRRVAVVGGGNSAVQIGYELAQVTDTTLFSRSDLVFAGQLIDGRDRHYWFDTLGFDRLPAAWLLHAFAGTPVVDDGRYRDAVKTGLLPRASMFSAVEGDRLRSADGGSFEADVLLFATGYRPDLPYLRGLGGVLDQNGVPRHQGGLSPTVPGLAFLGIEFQRSFSSNTLRGVSADAEHIAGPIAAWAHGAVGTIAAA